jgi:hypothetical protein
MTNFWQAATQHKKQHTVKTERRLYYDDAGRPTHYTGENLTGNYIIIEEQDFQEGRHDVLVIDGKLTRPNKITKFQKLIPSKQGVETLADDVTIVGTGQHWETKYYD